MTAAPGPDPDGGDAADLSPADPGAPEQSLDRVTLATALAAAPGAASWRDTAPTVLRAIRTHLGMEVAFISEFTDGQRIFRFVDANSRDAPVRAGEGGPLDESYCQRVVDGRLPQLIPDAAALSAAAELAVTASLPVGAHLSVPITLKDGRIYGTFCCFSHTADHSLNERDLAMMRVFADLTADQIDRELERDRNMADARQRIQEVIAGNALRVVFQPIIRLTDSQVAGFEALARFPDSPQRGPDAWFTEAAAVGLGLELEVAAVRLAIAALPELPPHAYLAVNVSPSTVSSGRLDGVLAGVPPTRLVVELTEHSVIPAYEDLAAALRPLRERGVRLAVDDAGAGYSSFRHILRLQPDLIKLDSTITRDIDRDRARRALATALIAFGRETGSDVVAEGVEREGELRTLQRLGVTTAQGYYLGRPAPLKLGARPSRTAE
jgi:EAL domain-containing protein (putative c-di-GMP-specific phosphodiesterase class I)